MKEWTLALDESGQFEGAHLEGECDETVGLIVGGVLFPGAPSELQDSWQRELERSCRAIGVGFPPHSTELDGDNRAKLGRVASSLLSAAGGHWVAVVQEPTRNQTADVALVAYARLLAEIVDLAGRLAASDGGSVLHVLPAQRSPRISSELAESAAGRSAFGTKESSGDENRVRALSEATVRDTMDALRREGSGHLVRRPGLGTLEVKSASAISCHPAVLLADLLCNRIYRTLRTSPSARLADLLGPLGNEELPAYIVAFRALSRIRALDRSLREIPANLARACRVVAELEGDSEAGASDLSRYHATVEGSAATSRALWEKACARLASSLPRNAEAPLARSLAASAEFELTAKTGAYEGLWPALFNAWAGDSELATRLRTRTADYKAAAKLWRLTLECANHRGDGESGQQAIEEFEKITRHHRSVALFAERLQVQNLRNVMLQNRLPAEPEHLETFRASLREAAQQLASDVDTAADFLEVVRDEADTDSRPQQSDTREPELWRALLDREPEWNAPDEERGRSYGTAARSMAFLGELDRAIQVAMKARSFFLNEDDLRFNAAVITRILLEQMRLSPSAREPAALQPAFDLAGGHALRTANRARDRIAESPAHRFVLDLWLRRLLWSGNFEEEKRTAWIKGLTANGRDSLFPLLSRGELRSHPTELIARHAGELLLRNGDREGANRWLDLSIAICDASPDGTLRRFGAFTKHLRANGGAPPPGSAPEGSILAPNFEYR